jgi:hypothetical protein
MYFERGLVFNCHKLLSNFAFNINLRHYSLATLMSTATELIDYACSEGLGRALGGVGARAPGSPSKAGWSLRAST